MKQSRLAFDNGEQRSYRKHAKGIFSEKRLFNSLAPTVSLWLEHIFIATSLCESFAWFFK